MFILTVETWKFTSLFLLFSSCLTHPSVVYFPAKVKHRRRRHGAWPPPPQEGPSSPSRFTRWILVAFCFEMLMTKDGKIEWLSDVLEKRSAEPGRKTIGGNITNAIFALFFLTHSLRLVFHASLNLTRLNCRSSPPSGQEEQDLVPC